MAGEASRRVGMMQASVSSGDVAVTEQRIGQPDLLRIICPALRIVRKVTAYGRAHAGVKSFMPTCAAKIRHRMLGRGDRGAGYAASTKFICWHGMVVSVIA